MKKPKPVMYPILETELAAACARGHIDSLEIVERRLGHEVVVNFKPRPPETRYLAVRRSPGEWRKFQDEDRMMKLIRKICPKSVVRYRLEEPHDRQAVKVAKKQRTKP